jgi:hypothetical protein
MEQCLLMIFAPPSVEEALVDWLLEQEGLAGFSTSEAHGHGGRTSSMSLLEQVTGRQRRVQFLIQTQADNVQRLVEELHGKFAGVGLHYFVLPVMASGAL